MSRYNHADTLIGDKYDLLGSGFVELVDYYGSDESIENAARVSYTKGTRQVSDRIKLINYLVSNRHTSPLEQACVTFHLRAPLFVIQQILRHRTAKINQESFRYSEVKNDYMTALEWRSQSSTNKQCSGDPIKNPVLSIHEKTLHQHLDNVYQERINSGVAREQARKDIPVSTFSELIWTMDIHNLLHFINLRYHKHAQIEIREYAYIFACFIKQIYPITFDAWYNHIFNSVQLSMSDIEEILIHVDKSKLSSKLSDKLTVRHDTMFNFSKEQI